MSADADKLSGALIEMSTGSRARLVCDVIADGDPDRIRQVETAIATLGGGEDVISWADALGEARIRGDAALEAAVSRSWRRG